MNILECDKDTHNDRCKYQLNQFFIKCDNQALL